MTSVEHFKRYYEQDRVTDFSWPKSSLETIWCNGVRRGARSSLGRPRRATSCTPGMRSRSWRRREWGKCTMYSISIIDFWSSTLCNQDMNEPGPGGIDVYFSGAMEKWLLNLMFGFFWCWYFALETWNLASIMCWMIPPRDYHFGKRTAWSLIYFWIMPIRAWVRNLKLRVPR